MDIAVASTGLNDFPDGFSAADSRFQSRLAGRLGIGGEGPVKVGITAGARAVTGSETRAVGSARISAVRGQNHGFWLSWQRDALALSPSAMLSAYGTLSPADKTGMGTVDQLEAGWSRGGKDTWHWKLAVFHRRLDNLSIEPYGANPFRAIPLRRVSAELTGLRFDVSRKLFGALDAECSGIECFNPPDEIPWLPGRRLTASLVLQGIGYDGDLGWSIRGETVYEGAMRFPVSDNLSSPLREQPGRFNFFGAASLRIIDFTIYGRADFLASDYYNGVDPLRMAGPRVVFGIDWVFLD